MDLCDPYLCFYVISGTSRFTFKRTLRPDLLRPGLEQDAGQFPPFGGHGIMVCLARTRLDADAEKRIIALSRLLRADAAGQL